MKEKIATREIFNEIFKEELSDLLYPIVLTEEGLYTVEILVKLTKERELDMAKTASNIVKIAVMLDKATLEYYIDGYENVYIVNEISNKQTVVEGNKKEIDRLIAALSRNCIKSVKLCDK